MSRITELSLNQNCAVGNIGEAIASDQPRPKRRRIVDLNIRVNTVGSTDPGVMFPALVTMAVQERLQQCRKRGRRRQRKRTRIGCASSRLEDECRQEQEECRQLSAHAEWWAFRRTLSMGNSWQRSGAKGAHSEYHGPMKNLTRRDLCAALPALAVLGSAFSDSTIAGAQTVLLPT